MKITKLSVSDFTPGFTHGTYVMSHVTQTQLAARIVRIETDSGDSGHGEIIRSVLQDPVSAASLEDTILPTIKGHELASLPGLARSLRLRDPALRGLAFGLETAHLDLVARLAGVPLYALLGGRLSDDLPDYFSLSADEGDAMIDRIKIGAADREVIQIKLGINSVAQDVDRVKQVLDAMGPSQKLLADFNGGLDVKTASAAIAQVTDARLTWEEPCRTYAENRDVVRATGIPVMFDQCLKTIDLYASACADQVAASVCIKPALLGGLSVAVAARDLCIDARLPVRIDGPWCGFIASAAALHVAIGAPPELLISGCDLTEPLALNEDWGGILRTSAGRIAPVEAPGHGVNVPL